MSNLSASNKSTRILELSRGKNGYGFTLSGQAPCFVSWIVDGSPAEQIGLVVGDCIASVNGSDVSKASHESVVKLIGMTSGSVFLGVSCQINKSHQMFGPSFIRPAKKDQVSEEAHQPPTSYSRTERVLQDLHSGAMFKNMASAKEESSKHLLVLMKSVVAYLGTVEMGTVVNSFQEAGFASVQRCVEALRMEQHIHQRVLIVVAQTCVKLQNADGATVAIHQADDIQYCDMYVHDNRFFYLVTRQSTLQGECSYLNHIFLIDPSISRHSVHIDKAKRFGIGCSAANNGECVEFPTSPRALLTLIRLLYLKSKSEDNTQENNEPAYHVVDPNQSQNRLTRGESSLPASMRISWTDTTKKTDQSNKNEFASLHGNTQYYGYLNKDRAQALQGINETRGQDMKMQTKKDSAHPNALHSVGVRKVSKLNEENLLQHESQTQSSQTSAARCPPPMQKLSLDKYSIPKTRGSTASLGRPTSKKKLGSRISHSKRHARLFPSHVTSPHAVSKSFDNVAASDDGDILSGASSIESLSSNVSLPSCINGSFARNSPTQERPHHRSSASNGGVDEGAGRISHWAVSFDRMLEDPLGVKYFKEFLRKEFSEENILFWEACEELRRCEPSDEDKLKDTIQGIYNRFLSLEAPMGVNIDSQGQQLAEEAVHSTPHPNIFLNQQQQVYTLMKLDSYSRFLKSSLYRQCMLCEMEGRPLPLDENHNDQNGLDSRNNSRTFDSDTLGRQTKKFKGSKKGIFSFKNRSKSQREKLSGSNTLTRQSSGDSTGSDPGPPLYRTASLPTNSLELIDASRVCHVTLWDNSSTVLYAKKTGGRTLSEALEDLCERRGTHLSAVDVFTVGETKENGDGVQKKSIPLHTDMCSLAGHSIVIERRALLRVDVRPAGMSVSVKARSTKAVSEVLEPVFEKYNLKLQDLNVKLSGDGKTVALHEPVSVLDGHRIVAEAKAPTNNRISRDKTRVSQSKATLQSDVPGKKDTEELIQLMASLQNSKLNDQRGLLSNADLELPDFLKLKPTNNNNNNNNNQDHHLSAASKCYDSDSSAATSSVRESKLHTDASGRQRSKSGERKRKLYVELNARPSSLSTFKPALPVDTASCSDASLSDDIIDATAIEDTTLCAEQFDPDLTLVPLPTPPRTERRFSGDNIPLADYSPPTPLHRK